MPELLTELFSSRVRAAVLSQLAPRPDTGMSLTELNRALGLPISSLQHECYKLERVGVLKSQREGNSRRYRLNPDFPALAPLVALVAAGMGQEAALRATLEPVSGLRAAFLGAALPLAANAGGASVPLVLIGEIPLEEVDAAQQRVAALLGLPADRVDTVFYLPADWNSRLAQGSAYALSLVAGPRVDLLGDPVAVAVG